MAKFRAILLCAIRVPNLTSFKNPKLKFDVNNVLKVRIPQREERTLVQ